MALKNTVEANLSEKIYFHCAGLYCAKRNLNTQEQQQQQRKMLARN